VVPLRRWLRAGYQRLYRPIGRADCAPKLVPEVYVRAPQICAAKPSPHFLAKLRKSKRQREIAGAPARRPQPPLTGVVPPRRQWWPSARLRANPADMTPGRPAVRARAKRPVATPARATRTTAVGPTLENLESSLSVERLRAERGYASTIDDLSPAMRSQEPYFFRPFFFFAIFFSLSSKPQPILT